MPSRLFAHDGGGLLAAAVVFAVGAVVRMASGDQDTTLFVLAVVFGVVGLAKASRGARPSG